MSEKLDVLFKAVFFESPKGISDDKKFDRLAKYAYESKDWVTIDSLRSIKESEEVELSQETAINFEDSLIFSTPRI